MKSSEYQCHLCSRSDHNSWWPSLQMTPEVLPLKKPMVSTATKDPLQIWLVLPHSYLHFKMSDTWVSPLSPPLLPEPEFYTSNQSWTLVSARHQPSLPQLLPMLCTLSGIAPPAVHLHAANLTLVNRPLSMCMPWKDPTATEVQADSQVPHSSLWALIWLYLQSLACTPACYTRLPSCTHAHSLSQILSLASSAVHTFVGWSCRHRSTHWHPGSQ